MMIMMTRKRTKRTIRKLTKLTISKRKSPNISEARAVPVSLGFGNS